MTTSVWTCILEGGMGVTDSADLPLQVLLCGGGLAALEVVLALRALLGDRALITLVSPGPHFAYPPAATLEVFDEDSAPDHGLAHRSYEPRAICEDLAVTYRRDRLAALLPKQHRVRLASSTHLSYDVLVLALGASATVAIPGALTFRDQRDVPQLRRLLAQVRVGDIDHLVFAIPSGCTWPLPLYQLALMTAAFAKRHHVRLDVSLLSPESAPLELLGDQASELLAGVLADRGVRFRGSSIPASLTADGALVLHFNSAIKADRVVCAPQLRGPRIAGLPSDWWHFVSTDSRGRVDRLPDVYAAGDMTACPIRQPGLAAQQADLIAHDIASLHGLAAGTGAGTNPDRVLRLRLLGGPEQLFLRLTLDEHAHPLQASLHVEAPRDIQPLAAAS
jgi:sulfide:quinone oxidoreductase